MKEYNLTESKFDQTPLAPDEIYSFILHPPEEIKLDRTRICPLTQFKKDREKKDDTRRIQTEK